MNAEAAQCENATIRKKCGKDHVFTTNGYVSMDDDCSDCGETSEDLFSDCEEKKDITYYSPNLSRVTNSTISNLSTSSLLHFNHQYSTPGAVVPTTPLSLLPFLSKVSEQWSSDLETPQADKAAGLCINRSATSLKSSEKIVNQKQCTPPVLNMSKECECITVSPVINCRKIRNRTKRRIFRSGIGSPSGSKLPNFSECRKHIELDSEESEKQAECENKDRKRIIPHIQEMVCCANSDGENIQINTCLTGNSVTNIMNTSPIVKSHNTSTQDFFTNASFTDVDKLSENNSIEGNKNVTQVALEGKRRDHESGYQKLLQRGKHGETYKRNDAEVILNRVNVCKRLVKDCIAEEKHKDTKITTKNVVQKGQCDDILTKATDIHFNTSIDTQDWFINEREFDQTKHLSVMKYESTDGASVSQQQEECVRKKIACDNYVNSKSTKKQQNVIHLQKRLTCAELEFEEFLKNIDLCEYEKPLYGFTSEETSMAETKLSSTNKLICNLEVADSFSHTVKNEKCMIQNNNSCNTSDGMSVPLSEKASSKRRIPVPDKCLDNREVAVLFLRPEAKGDNNASGKSIKLTDGTLSKAKAFSAGEFTKKVKDSQLFLEPQKLSQCNQGIDEPCNFFTANGKSVELSATAMSKAKAIFADIFNHDEDIEMFEESFKKQNTNEGDLTNFTTAKTYPMNVSREISFVVKNLFTDKRTNNNKRSDCSVEKEKETQNIVKNNDFCGFSTAKGKSIALSDEALTKARAVFANDIPGDIEDIDMLEQPFKIQKINKEDLGNLTTARGRSIKIPQIAISKAETIFASEVEDTIARTPCVNELMNLNESSKFSVQVSTVNTNVSKSDVSCGFSTANGKPIELSDDALSKAKLLFAEEFVSVQPLEELKVKQKNLIGFDKANGEVKKVSERPKFQTKTPVAFKLNALSKATKLDTRNDSDKENGGSFLFSTASGKPVYVSEKSLMKAQECFANDLDDTAEAHSSAKSLLGEEQFNVTNLVLPNNRGVQSDPSSSTPINGAFKPVQKRKISNSDDDTPLGRCSTYGFKKQRFSDERQGIRLFSDDVNAGKNIKQQSPNSVSTTVGCKPPHVLDEQISKKHKVARSLSDELAASASALLADETNDNCLTNWSPQTGEKAIEKSTVALSCSTSPVLGRPIILQRRNKRKAIGCTSVAVPDIEQNIISGKKNHRLSDSTYCGKISQSDATTNSVQSRTNLDSIKTNDFIDTQLIMDFIDKTTDISEKRLAAALEQEKIIRLKKTNKPKQTIGTLLLYKESNKNKRVSWKKLTNGSAPILYSPKEAMDHNIAPEICNMTANTAGAYKFRCCDFYGSNVADTNINGLELGDGVRLILDENGYVGLPEISRALLASPGVDPALMPVGWIKNHYRWIVWKLASMDKVKFSSVILPRALTLARVMEQLKYRYDREIDQSQRPAVRRILEKDDAASKRMVLCVSSLVECKNAEVVGRSPSIAIASSWKMVLTDGWYSVPACIDLAMIHNITSGKVKEGTKLLIYGAELLNSEQGCSPLEIPGDIALKIHTNSTRRVKWFAKMGFSSRPGPMPVKLQSVCPHGGLIGKVTVTIVRVYPLLYHEKTTTGESIFRNARCEEKVNLAYEQECRSKMEALYARTEKYFSVGKKNLPTDTEADSMDFLAAELSEQCQHLSDEEFMSKQQQQNLLNNCRMKEEEFKQKMESRLRDNLPPQRKVSPVLKLRVADEKRFALLTVWSPSDDIMDILKEGNRVLMCGVLASGKRADELQLTTGRSTVFKLETKNAIGYPNRICTPLCSIADPAFNPSYGELDTVGLIVSIQNGPYGMKNFEAATLVCRRKQSPDYSYLSILFWQSIAAYGYKEIVTVGSFVACSNLEWRRATTASIPLVYCTERTIFTRNPRQVYLQNAIDALKASITEPSICIENCVEEINAELQKKLIAKSPGCITPNKPIPTVAPHKSTGENLGSINSSIVNPRSSSVQKRLEKLKWYGEPSELPPIIVNTRSTRISLDFRSPVANRKVTATRPA